ncbi:hypothetical protein B0H16DRAFT_1743678 [Mycena metata]|uniref:Uncharacterized protein n=1 Tax=Mycena metata TaxID=1033252 RepID=A0AAD7H6B1_9AGAR|nr:hypothetical protein B0H16DRAFT_1743678 [Mycena metata]
MFLPDAAIISGRGRLLVSVPLFRATAYLSCFLVQVALSLLAMCSSPNEIRVDLNAGFKSVPDRPYTSFLPHKCAHSVVLFCRLVLHSPPLLLKS